MAGLYRLRVESGLSPGDVFPLEKSMNVIGRDSGCDVVLEDIEVSRRHAIIRFRGEICEIQDNGSTNGTFVNGLSIESVTRVSPGDLIGLGETVKLRFELAVDLGQGKNDVPLKGEIARPRPYPPVDQPDPAIAPPAPIVEESGQQAPPHRLGDNGEHYETIELPNPLPTQKPLPIWLLIVLITLAAAILFCGLPMIIIDITDSWCNLFGGIFNAIRPLTCP